MLVDQDLIKLGQRMMREMTRYAIVLTDSEGQMEMIGPYGQATTARMIAESRATYDEHVTVEIVRLTTTRVVK